MTSHQKYSRHNQCTNCGDVGHHFRNCTAPVLSYGIIAFRLKNTDINQEHTLSLSNIDKLEISLPLFEYLLIQRRDSIGYVELLRAKYKLSDIDYISHQITGITEEERQKLLTLSFQDLWISLWGSNSGETRQYKQEYEQAKLKFESLRDGYEHNGEHISLQILFSKNPVQWTTPEWGFPKGRRNTGETDYSCAVREFKEETGLRDSDFRILETIEPIKESFIGNNGIHYCHMYYIAWVSSKIPVHIQTDNELMTREVGDIQWFSFEDAVNHIRTTNMEKRNVLRHVSSLLRTLYPNLSGHDAQPAEQSAQKEADDTNRRGGTNERSWQQWYIREFPGGGPATRHSTSTSTSTYSNWSHTSSTGCPSKGRTFNFVEDTE